MSKENVLKASVYLQGTALAEMTRLSSHLGVSVSKLVRDSWTLAKSYSGDPIEGTLLPLSNEHKQLLEGINDTSNR